MAVRSCARSWSSPTRPAPRPTSRDGADSVQDYFDNGILQPVDDYFNKWDEKADYFPNVVEQMRSKPGQPVLYMPQTSIPYVLYYRADWFDEARIAPPETYDEFIAAAKAITKAPDRYGFALRGLTYSASSRSSRSGRAPASSSSTRGKVDFDSGGDRGHREMGRHVHQGQVGAADRRQRPLSELFALMEKAAADVDLRNACDPRHDDALGMRSRRCRTPTSDRTATCWPTRKAR